ncbi:MAG: RagB/SusD family nutrient uptake outer membrane protein [Bacteroidia bacterium]|nr:RagB/SusD family nutrient uptake outer membrane protein [Bacteroidia bacterium]
MIRKIKYSILIVLAVMLGTSCEKWLDLKPEDGIIRQNFWKTKEDVKSSVIGCYSSLFATTQTLFLWGEIRGDMITSTLRSSAEQTEIMNGNILSSNSITNWRVIYKTINYCNTVIDFAPDVLKTDQTFKEEDLNGYLAEVRTLRALMYFNLLRSFGEVPLKLTATASDADLVQLEKSSQQDVYDQIVADLAFAEQYAPLTYGVREQDKGRITRYAVYALQADVYLWMENYTDCITACDKVINSNQFGLIAGRIPNEDNTDSIPNPQWFNTVFYVGNSNESIFEFQYDNQILNPFYNLVISSNRQFTGSTFVMDEMYTIDLLDDTKKDIRGDLASIRSSDMVIWKYAGANNTGSMRSQTTSYAHWFVYRYPDILLMKAEALAWTSQGHAALNIVKEIRDRANALAATERSPDPSSASEISDYIMEERAREFAFEGKRWYDILRNAKRNDYANLQYMIDIITKIAPADRQQSMINKYMDVRSHYLPINLYELQTDKNLVQNPFYQ